MRPAYIGIDVAIAKYKFLPIAACTWNDGCFVPQGLFKTEVIRRLRRDGISRPSNSPTLDWVDWFNHRRLLSRSATCPQRSTRPASES
jgi:hypothetical protein